MLTQRCRYDCELDHTRSRNFRDSGPFAVPRRALAASPGGFSLPSCLPGAAYGSLGIGSLLPGVLTGRRHDQQHQRG